MTGRRWVTWYPAATESLCSWVSYLPLLFLHCPTRTLLRSIHQQLIRTADYNSDTSQVPYILDEFAYFFETPFDPQEDQLSGCDIDRPAGASADGRLILANHNRNVEVLGIDLPDLAHAGDTNSVSSITAQSDTCNSQHGRIPNVVLVSSHFYSIL